MRQGRIATLFDLGRHDDRWPSVRSWLEYDLGDYTVGVRWDAESYPDERYRTKGHIFKTHTTITIVPLPCLHLIVRIFVPRRWEGR